MRFSDKHLAFLSLIRAGVAHNVAHTLPDQIDWPAIQAIAAEHGLIGILLDGLGFIMGVCPKQGYDKGSMQKKLWIARVLQQEQQYAMQQIEASKIAVIFNRHSIRTYVLKGFVVAECYPIPSHRLSSDLDCFLLPAVGEEDVWEKGNRLIEEAGYKVDRSFYKNSTFYLPGLSVENHRFMTPFRGNKNLKRLESLLQELIFKDKGDDRFESTYLCRPPVIVSALFLVEHAYSHFLHEGLIWRHILDWMMFSEKHKGEIEWTAFDAFVDNFGMRRFYDSFCNLGRYLLGEVTEEDLNARDKMMLADVWAPLDLHETLSGVKGKLALAGNTWRARWKYRYFTNISWLHALWIQVKGFIFIPHPDLK